jgi:hypothetical protein
MIAILALLAGAVSGVAWGWATRPLNDDYYSDYSAATALVIFIRTMIALIITLSAWLAFCIAWLIIE